MHKENINFRKNNVAIAFFQLMDNGITYSFWKKLEKFYNLLRFRAPLAMGVQSFRDAFSENIP